MTTVYLWKPIPGHAGYSICLITGTVRNNGTGRLLTACYRRSAYRWYWRIGIRGKCCRIHRLVMSAALGRQLAPTELVRHLDGDASHNAAINLAVGSARQHSADKLTHGTNGHRLRNADVREMRALAGRMGYAALARRYGVTRKWAWAVATRRVWRGLP